jgi:hypothetical protein
MPFNKHAAEHDDSGYRSDRIKHVYDGNAVARHDFELDRTNPSDGLEPIGRYCIMATLPASFKTARQRTQQSTRRSKIGAHFQEYSAPTL